MIHLFVQKGANTQKIPLDLEVFSIGSSEEDDLVLTEPEVEAHHIKLVKTSTGWLVIPKRQGIGGMINGKALEKTSFQEGDILMVGTTKITLLLQKEPSLAGSANGPIEPNSNVKEPKNLIQEEVENLNGLPKLQKSEKWFISEGAAFFLFLLFFLIFVYLWNQAYCFFWTPKTQKSSAAAVDRMSKSPSMEMEKKKKEKEAWERAKDYILYLGSQDILQRMESTRLLKKHLEENPFLLSKVKKIRDSTKDGTVQWRLHWILENLNQPYTQDPLRAIPQIYLPNRKAKVSKKKDKKG